MKLDFKDYFSYILPMYEQPVTSICIECKQELPTTEEFWYKRSDRPGNVHLGRCRDCSREYKRLWRSKKVFDETDMITCPKCGKDKPATQEFWYKRTDVSNGGFMLASCRECRNEDKKVWLAHSEDTPKPDMVYSEPYTYGSRWQRVTTESFLRSIGWRKMEGEGWFKPGVKEADGSWTKMPDDVIKTGEGILTFEDCESIRTRWKRTVYKYEDFMYEYNITKAKIDQAIRGDHLKVKQHFGK